ncbi:hypothetical protein WMY93_014675 [Mugilogobius chulae]|uniref:Lipoprotein n=1 Tax=Mugilogobius chulae TaxID=88201 RepID=A0AAW0NV62_9GOBI
MTHLSCFHRKGMLFILILMFGSCASELFHYEGKEGQDILLKWESPRPLDLSLLHIDCNFKSKSSKMMIYVDKGKRQTEHEDSHFSGRVEWNMMVLKKGKVQFRLTNLTVLDAGEYHYKMTARDKDLWYFEYNESQTATGRLLLTPPFHHLR